MAQNTFPKFTEMIPTVEDIQLIVDSLRQEDRLRTTKDGIFNPGIVNQPDSYLQAGSTENSLKIKPFIAYTANGNRIEVSSTWDKLYAQGSSITVTNDNLALEYENIPVWNPYNISYENFDQETDVYEESFTLTKLGQGSILHGIKLKIDSLFSISDAETQPNVYACIGIDGEPEKFLPKTLISELDLSSSISVMNLMYSLNDTSSTDIKLTITSDSAYLNTLTNGSLIIHLCIANLSNFDHSDIVQDYGGFKLNNETTGTWQASTRYHIVVRYEETKSDYRQLNYTTLDGTNIQTLSEPTRVTSSYSFYALRKTGSIIDYTTLDDVKLGEVVTDVSGNISKIYINGKNNNGDLYTQYLTLPGYRFAEGIDASQIGDGKVTNQEFGYLNNLNGNIQDQLNNKVSLNSDNVFKGDNTFEKQIKGSIDKVNGFTAFATPSSNSLLVLDENGKVPSDALSESTIASIGNLYTVSSGVTTNGRASFLSANTDNNGVVIGASEENPLVLNYSDGSAEKFTATQTITGVDADGYYYLVKEKGGGFLFLPTSGGTKACISNAASNGQFAFTESDSSIGTGTVSKTYNSGDGTAYMACDGIMTTGALMGSAVYKNYTDAESSFVGTPSSIATSIIIMFPEAINITGMSACFRQNEYDLTPKSWSLYASNDGTNWTTEPIISSTTETWNIGQIKRFEVPPLATAYKYYRFTTNINQTATNNYMEGEETDIDGYTMYLRCYYLQFFMTNNVSTGNIITEGYVKPSNASLGDYFLDISKKPYTGYKCIDANTFAKQEYVKLGFVNRITENNVTTLTVYPFCYNTFTYSDANTLKYWNTSTWSYSENVVLNRALFFEHNLGIIPNIIQVKFQCISANNNYSVGDFIDNIYSSDSVGLTSIKDSLETTVTSIKLQCGIAAQTLYVKNKTTGALGSISSNQWKVIIYCSRGW